MVMMVVETHCFCRCREAWFAASTPTMLALVEQLRSYLGGGCEWSSWHAGCCTIYIINVFAIIETFSSRELILKIRA